MKLVFYSKSIVSADITRVLLTWADYNPIDEQVSVVCATRNFVYMCWILGDFSDQCQDIERKLIHNAYQFYYASFCNAWRCGTTDCTNMLPFSVALLVCCHFCLKACLAFCAACGSSGNSNLRWLRCLLTVTLVQIRSYTRVLTIRYDHQEGNCASGQELLHIWRSWVRQH